MTYLAVKEIPLLLGGDKNSVSIGKKESPHILTRKKFLICRLEIERKILKYWVEIETNFSNTGWR
jgi:hypothetical protein